MIKTHSPTDERLLTVIEAANYLSVAPVTLRRWVRFGLIPSVRLGRARRVRLGDIEALMRVGLPLDRDAVVMKVNV